MKIQLTRQARKGFTLIELLVVITILAILMTIAVPGITGAIGKARLTASAAQVNGIVKMLVMYSTDNNQNFPYTEEEDSNSAFRMLFEEGIAKKEDPFFNPQSMYCKRVKKVDNLVGANDGEVDEECLKPGENHWAYVNGLDMLKEGPPIMADGFTGEDGTSYDDAHPWFGQKKAIVGYPDGGVKQEKLSKTEPYQVQDARKRNIFGEDLLPSGVAVLNPSR